MEERNSELADNTPFSNDVQKCYQPEEERIQEQIYKLDLDLELQKLKRFL